ncbi:MAG: tetratricopeptide repeat protein [Gammaproteobacteria bacterium]
MRTPPRLALLPLTALLAGAACAPDNVKEEPKEQVVVETNKEVELQPLPPVSRQGDFRTALDLLDRGGDPALAKRHLRREIEQLPEKRTIRARRLLEEIEAEPESYFAKNYGRGSFEYRVRPGDQLSTIANEFLGSPYSFYILGRYNGLNRLNLVDVGQTLRIPGRRRSIPPREEANQERERQAERQRAERQRAERQRAEQERAEQERAEQERAEQERAEQQLATAARNPATEARELIAQGDYKGAISVLEPYKYDANNRIMLFDLYLETARRAEAGGQLEEAQIDLEKAQALDPSSPTVGERLAVIEDKLRIETLMRSAEAAQNRGEIDEAIGLYRQVLAINPNHAQARQQNRVLTKSRIQYWQRVAVAAQRRQELDKAIFGWGKVLELDGDHARAKLKLDELAELKAHVGEIPQSETESSN